MGDKLSRERLGPGINCIALLLPTQNARIARINQGEFTRDALQEAGLCPFATTPKQILAQCVIKRRSGRISPPIAPALVVDIALQFPPGAAKLPESHQLALFGRRMLPDEFQGLGIEPGITQQFDALLVDGWNRCGIIHAPFSFSVVRQAYS